MHSRKSFFAKIVSVVIAFNVGSGRQAKFRSGAKSLVRGGPSKDPRLAGGAFYHPTLVEVADSTLPLVREETFGPVQTLQVFDTEEEAIRMANDSAERLRVEP